MTFPPTVGAYVSRETCDHRRPGAPVEQAAISFVGAPRSSDIDLSARSSCSFSIRASRWSRSTPLPDSLLGRVVLRRESGFCCAGPSGRTGRFYRQSARSSRPAGAVPRPLRRDLETLAPSRVATHSVRSCVQSISVRRVGVLLVRPTDQDCSWGDCGRRSAPVDRRAAVMSGPL